MESLKLTVQTYTLDNLFSYFEQQCDKDKKRLITLIAHSRRKELYPLSQLFTKDCTQHLLQADYKIVSFVLTHHRKNYYIHQINVDNQTYFYNFELDEVAMRCIDEGWNDLFNKCVELGYSLYMDMGTDKPLSFITSVVIHCVIMGYYEKARELYDNVPDALQGWNWSNAPEAILDHVVSYVVIQEDVEAAKFVGSLGEDVFVTELRLKSLHNSEYVRFAVEKFLQNKDKNFVFDRLRDYANNSEVLQAALKYDKDIHKRLVSLLEESV